MNNFERVTHDDKAFAFMMSKFPDSEKRADGKSYLATCNECGAKKKLWWFDNLPYNSGCYACGYTCKSVYDMGYKSDNVRNFSDNNSTESLVRSFHNKTGKKHRLSMPVINEFNIQPVKFNKKKGVGHYYNLAIPDNTSMGCTKHLNFDGRWISIEAEYRTGRRWLNTERLKATDEFIFVLAGEWDMFAFWEHVGLHGISPVDGETSSKRLSADDCNIFSNKKIVILYDNDKAGRASARQLAKTIQKYVKTKWIKCPDLSRLGIQGGGDIDDFFALGGTKERLKEEIDATPEFTSDMGEDDIELERISEAFPRPENPESILDEDILDKIWKTLLLPEPKRLFLFGEIAESEGITKEKHLATYRERIKTYTLELNTLRYEAYDQLISEWFDKYHIKQSVRHGEMSESLYYYYKDGYYQFFSEEFLTLSADEVAKKITAPDDRLVLSRTRKQCMEDIKIKMVNAEQTNFDSYKDYINFSNGTYLLKDKKLVDHSPEFLINYKLPIEYKEDAECPNFREALNDWTHNAEDKKELLKALYYLISGDRSKQVVLWLHGDGNDGKGEFTQLCRSLVGERRTSSLAIETMEKTHYTAELFNKSLNIADEVPKGYIIPDAIFKRVTGNSIITADPKYKGLFSFISKALWIIPSNHFPGVADTSHGYFRRFKIFLFKKIPKTKEVAHFFESKLRPELSGIVNLILTDGRHYYETEGFVKTKSELEASVEMKEKNSAFLYWNNVTSLWENAVTEMIDELRATGDWSVIPNGEKELRKRAIISVTKDCTELNYTDEHHLLQPWKQNGKDIWLCNPNAHYKHYRDYFKGDEVRLLSAQNFRQSTMNFLRDYFPESNIEKIRLWSKDIDSTKKKNLTYLRVV